MNDKAIATGRVVIAKYCAISVLFIVAFPLVFAWVMGYGVETFARNIFRDISENLFVSLIQIPVIGLAIYLIGGEAGRLILSARHNAFLIGFLSLFTLWIVLFLSIAIAEAIIHSKRYGVDGFVSGIMGWIRYGLPPFMIWGIAPGLGMGYLLGNAIRRKSRKSTSGH